MGFLLFFGCFLMTFSPAAALFYFVVGKSPRLIILTIGSSFFYLLSIFLASIWWFIIPPLRSVPYWTIPWSVFFQEILRFGFYRLYLRAESGFVSKKVKQTTHLTTHPDDIKAALALGWGYGMTQSAIGYGTILWESTGPAAAFSPSCPGINLFVFSGLFSLAFIILHICWTVLSFDAFRQRKWWKLIAVAFCHLAISMLTLLNQSGGNCWAALILVWSSTIALMVLTWITMVKRLES